MAVASVPGKKTQIQAKFPYLARSPLYAKQKPFATDFTPREVPVSTPLTNHRFDFQELAVTDAQDARSAFTLGRNGFCFLTCPTAVRYEDYGDVGVLENIYYAEIEAVLHAAFPEYSRLECLDHQVRSSFAGRTKELLGLESDRKVEKKKKKGGGGVSKEVCRAKSASKFLDSEACSRLPGAARQTSPRCAAGRAAAYRFQLRRHELRHAPLLSWPGTVLARPGFWSLEVRTSKPLPLPPSGLKPFFPSTPFRKNGFWPLPTNTHSIWRVLKGPNNDWPLALCDFQSVDPADAVLNDVLHEDSVGENELLYKDGGHKWYYLQDQQVDDLIVFRNNDRWERRASTPFQPFPSFFLVLVACIVGFFCIELIKLDWKRARWRALLISIHFRSLPCSIWYGSGRSA